MARGKKNPTFEESVDELEQIIEQIESGEVGLEESLARYEQGMKLIVHCRSVLDRAERRIAELTKTASGDLVVTESGEQEAVEQAEAPASGQAEGGTGPDDDEPPF
jgi:exodeoxyribonuclease VII small subunit